MNILFPIAEAAPLYKIGGLGDVGGALPKALTPLGYDVRIALPKHPEINVAAADMALQSEFDIVYNQQNLHVRVLTTLLPGTSVPVYLFEEPVYLSEHTGASDNHADKFSVFSLAVATWTTYHSPYWQPHVVHCHDWHTALIPVILKHKLHNHKYKTIITIHNLAYQGTTTTPVPHHLDIDPSHCQILSWDLADGDLNILLEGLLHVDFITTVSPTYAEEILTNEYGEKINHILESKRIRIQGILNGIDTQVYDPEHDPLLVRRFGKSDWSKGKAENRADIRRKLGLAAGDNQLLVCFIGRVDPYQKGIGLMIQAMNERSLPPENTQFVFLGTGDPSLETQLHRAGDSHPRIRVITRFDEPLAHQLYAASHLTVIPSRFEPCGLVQLIAMRYGCLPVARSTGGLADTITHTQNGFLFKEFSAAAMMTSLQRAIDHIHGEAYNPMVESAITADYSWKPSAQQYGALYESLVIGKKAVSNPTIDNGINI